jgi:hypothetical protein
MTTQATQIRDAIFSRLATLPGYATKRKTPVPQLQRNLLPALSVYSPDEDWLPAGDNAFAGEPQFVNSATIRISILRGFDDPVVLDGSIDGDMDVIAETLLTDPTFIGQSGALFEGITRIQRRRAYPQDGEAYFAELRLDMTFQFHTTWPPAGISNAFEQMQVTADTTDPATQVA